jgi:DNA-binding transcriptional MerR regulator
VLLAFMGTSLVVQPDVKSNCCMDPIPIGETARRLGFTASALRNYDDQGLVRPATRRAGRRMFGSDQLRRLAFIKIMTQLGIGHDVVRAVLDQPAGSCH